MKTWPLLITLSAALPLMAQQAEAQPDEGPDWYQVELLIFASQDPEAALSESWTLLPELSYPESLLLLRRDGPRVAADQVLQLQALEQQTLPATFDLAWDTSVEQLLARYYHSLLWRQPSIELEPLFDLDVPLAYALLPVEQWEFAAERRRLDNNPGLQVLFHESWLQPMRGQAESTAIVVDSGPVRGDFTTLQGSIRIYRGRYLHLETNLWLNTDGSYLTNNWAMPAPPLPRTAEPQLIQPFAVPVTDDWLSLAGPVEEPIPAEAMEELSPAETLQELPPAETLEGRPPPETVQELAQAEPGPVADEMASTAEHFAPPWEADIDADAIPAAEMEAGPPPLTAAELQAFLDSPDYAWRHAVLLQQSRRMRGGELHYIDHPMFGLLIKVTRYKFEPFVETEPAVSLVRRR
jgi:hypothetical protein